MCAIYNHQTDDDENDDDDDEIEETKTFSTWFPPFLSYLFQ